MLRWCAGESQSINRRVVPPVEFGYLLAVDAPVFQMRSDTEWNDVLQVAGFQLFNGLVIKVIVVVMGYQHNVDILNVVDIEHRRLKTPGDPGIGEA